MSVSRLWLWVLLSSFVVLSLGVLSHPSSSSLHRYVLDGFLSPISLAFSQSSKKPHQSKLGHGSLTGLQPLFSQPSGKPHKSKTRSKGPTIARKDSSRNVRTWEIRPDSPKSLAPSVQRSREKRRDLAYWIKLQRRLGDNVWQAGVHYQSKLRELRHLCDRPNAPPAQCDIYRLSQKIFSINYNTPPSNYRGYVTFNSKRKHLIPRQLMRRYYRLSSKRFRKTGDQCYIKQGLLSNCMTFAMCSQKSAMWNFKGTWGQGFGYPYWGTVQYLTSQAYYRHMKDYEKKGQMRAGVQTLMRRFNDLDLNDKRKFSRRLLLDIYDTYVSMVNRRTRKKRSRNKYKKAFCSNIVVNAGSFQRSLPGDVFGLMYVYKRLHPSTTPYRYHFQHWGLIVKPEIKYVLHNQTPGGLWGKKFKSWGIQFGRFPRLSRDWTWHKKSGRYRKMMFLVHRLNLHYFVQARLQHTKIYDATQPQFCRQWIRRHADLYFTDMSEPLP